MYDMLSGARAGKLLATRWYQERPQSLRIGERTSSRLNASDGGSLLTVQGRLREAGSPPLAPDFGQHTDEVLGEVGFSSDAIDHLRTASRSSTAPIREIGAFAVGPHALCSRITNSFLRELEQNVQCEDGIPQADSRA